MGKATQDLRKEHEAILYVLQILDKMTESDNRDAETLFHYYGEVVYFLKTFADKCHHGKEENYLFKELVNKGIPNEGGPVGVMKCYNFSFFCCRCQRIAGQIGLKQNFYPLGSLFINHGFSVCNPVTVWSVAHLSHQPFFQRNAAS